MVAKKEIPGVRPDSPKEQRPKPAKTMGVPGTAIFGGYIIEEEKSPSLVGRRKYKTYSDILANVSIVAAGTRFFLNLVSRAKWTIEPADDSDAAKDLAEKVEEIINGMETPWHRVIRRSAMYRFYGFSIQEWTAIKLDDGAIGLKDIAPRPQITIEKWDQDENGKIVGVVQRSPQNGEEIYLPITKLIYMVDDSLNDSPEGLGLFRHVVDAATRLIRYEQLEGFGYETDLRGVPVVKAPYADLQRQVASGEITQEEMNAIVEPMQTFIKKHIKNPQLGVIIDSMPYFSEGDTSENVSSVTKWAIDLLQGTAGAAQQEIAKAIERLNQEIARILGVEGLLLGSTKVGSQALSKDKSHNFALIVDSTLEELGENYEKSIVDTLWNLNGWPDDLKPALKPEATARQDINEITQALADMANAGAPLMPDDPAINDVRDLLGISQQPEMDMESGSSLLEGNNRGSQMQERESESDDLETEVA